MLIFENEFTVREYQMNDTAREFEQWYKQVFSLDNPGLASAFTFETVKYPTYEVLEVTALYIAINIMALEAMFESFTKHSSLLHAEINRNAKVSNQSTDKE